MTIKDIRDIVQEHLDKVGNSRYVSYNDWDILNDFIEIYIEWGDWKHDHARTRCDVLKVVQSIPGYLNWKECLTESDGSDCYSACHRFYFSKEKIRE